MKVQRSKTGLPTLSENGGGMSNTGFATIICGSEGQPLKPLLTLLGYSNGEHAIFVVRPNQTCIIDAYRNRDGESASIECIVEINDDDTCKTKLIGNYENGDGDIPANFQSAVEAALEKTRCYHCREVHYANK